MQSDLHRPPTWMSPMLVLAGLYSLFWAIIAYFSSAAIFASLEIASTGYPAFWNVTAMAHGIFGIGLLIAATHPYRHWPLVLLALCMKVAEPVVFLNAAVSEALPWSYGWIMAGVNGLWWGPLAVALVHVRQARLAHVRSQVIRDELAERRALRRAVDQHEVSVAEHSRQRTVLLVVLRHFGCTFCRETLWDLSVQRAMLEARGIRPVIVHMTEDEYARRQLRRYGLEDVPRISDPRRRLHRALGLSRGTFGQLAGVRVLWRGLVALFEGHGIGRPAGDTLQMPGCFLIDQGQVVVARRHERISDRYDFEQLVCPAADPSLPIDLS